MRILFFAQLKDATGCSEIEWPDVGTMDCNQLWERLLKEFPDLTAHQSCVRLACNGAYATTGESFQGEDEVALIPPVSGG